MLYSRPVKKNFTCKQDHNNVGLSEVIVDERMAAVVDFKCRTSDLINLICSFRKPVAFLPIKYRFSFAVNDDTVSHFEPFPVKIQLTKDFFIRLTNQRQNLTEKEVTAVRLKFLKLAKVRVKYPSALSFMLQTGFTG